MAGNVCTAMPGTSPVSQASSFASAAGPMIVTWMPADRAASAKEITEYTGPPYDRRILGATCRILITRRHSDDARCRMSLERCFQHPDSKHDELQSIIV